MQETIKRNPASVVRLVLGEVPPRGALAPRVAYADGFRVFAIAMVVLYHTLSYGKVRIPARYLLWIGTWGVDCFFVLTGFLLSTPFLAAIIHDKPLPDVKKYAARRFLRIYPLYLFALIASVPVWTLLLNKTFLPLSFVAHIFMLHGFRASYLADINAPMWTMSVDRAILRTTADGRVCFAPPHA